MIRSRIAEERPESQPDKKALSDSFHFSLSISNSCSLLIEERNEVNALFLLQDLRFLNLFYLSLGERKWWRIRLDNLHLLADEDAIIEDMRRCLKRFVRDYIREGRGDWISTMQRKIMVWKEHVVKNYPLLLNGEPETSSGFISCKSMDQFINALCAIALQLLEYRDDLHDDELKAIRTVKFKLSFLRVFVQLAESEGMRSVLDYIQDYIIKVKLVFYPFWTAETRGERMDDSLSALVQRGIKDDEPCGILIILDVLKITKKTLLGVGMAWGYESHAVITKNLIWEYTLEWICQILEDDFSKELLNYFSSLTFHLECGIHRLHECLSFLPSFVNDLSLDMRVMVIRAATFLGLLYAFSFGDLSEEEIGNMNFHLSALVTSLNLFMVEVSVMKLMSHHFSVIVLMMAQLKDLQDGLEFLREYFMDMEDGYTKDKLLLMSQSEAVVSDTLSFIDLLVEHEMEDDTCIEINLAFLKLLGTTKLIGAHVLALQLLNSHNSVAFQMEDQLVKLCNKLGFLVELMENFDQNNVNQTMFLLDTGGVVIKVASLVSLFSMDMTEEKLNEGNTLLLKLIADIELLEAELMLNSFLNHHVDVIVPFGNIEMLRNGFRFLRILFMDSEEPDSVDKILVSLGVEWVSKARPLVSLLFDNISNVDMAMEMNDSVSFLLDQMNDLETDVTALYLKIRTSSHSTQPRTDRLGFIDCLMDNLSNLSSSMPTFSWMKFQLERTFNALNSSTSSLKAIVLEHNEDDELNNFVSQLTQAAYEVEYFAEAFVIGDSNTWSKRLWISDLIDEIKQISLEITDFLANRSYNGGVGDPLRTSHRVLLPVDTPSTNEVVVGMKEHEEKAINQLTRGSTKLGIVSIVGMGGLGKTTLAKKVFNVPLVRNSFDVLAWCCISKVYQKREILLDLLGYIIEVTPEIRKMTDDDLSNRLRQLLLERTYLIVMDDIWDIRPWKELQQSFPKDDKRSRILFTSRSNDISSKTGYGFEPCSLDLLSDKESWELLERRLFEGGSCPLQFREFGWEIATNCKGLPLAVVVISGLLSTKETNLDWWKQIAGNLNSFVVGNSKTFTNTIDLSYLYLPDYLKPCFLYFGAFQEDEKILVSNLIDLWTTEGFIRRNDHKNLNDAARDYLQELVSRNLVSVAERTSMGGIKACHIHDLLHELCRAKAEDENFLHVVKDLDNSSSSVCNAVDYEQRRVCIYSERRNFIESRPSGQFVRSLLFFATKDYSPRCQYDASFISLNFKLLKTLKLDSINIGNSLPDGIELLVHLKFLAVLGSMRSIPDSIKCLSYLEVFSMKGLRGEISLPHSIWCLKRLRHLLVKDRFAFSSIKEILNELPRLDNLESLSSVFLPSDEASMEHILQRLLSLKKLKCIFSESWNESKNCNQFPSLNSLVQLESLKVLYHGRVRHPSVFSYPATLKKLTLSKFRLPWKEISAIGCLPCLEVLKLLFKAFEGEEWEVGSEEFQKLKYLKLDSLDIVRWNTCYDSFPCIEQIVLQSCKKLEEVPFAFAESPTLQMIRVQWCSKAVVKSVRDIEGEQFETLARTLNVIVHPIDS